MPKTRVNEQRDTHYDFLVLEKRPKALDWRRNHFLLSRERCFSLLPGPQRKAGSDTACWRSRMDLDSFLYGNDGPCGNNGSRGIDHIRGDDVSAARGNQRARGNRLRRSATTDSSTHLGRCLGALFNRAQQFIVRFVKAAKPSRPWIRLDDLARLHHK